MEGGGVGWCGVVKLTENWWYSSIHSSYQFSLTIYNSLLPAIINVSFRTQMDLDDGHVNTDRQKTQLEDSSLRADTESYVRWTNHPL